MKLFSTKKSLIIFIYFFVFFSGCTDEEQSIESQIEIHDNHISVLSDSIKIMDHKIDSLLKLYSGK